MMGASLGRHMLVHNLEDSEAIVVGASLRGRPIDTGQAASQGNSAPTEGHPTSFEQSSRSTFGRHVLIHNQERSEAMEVVSVSFSGKVVSNVSDIRSFTNVSNVR